MSPQEVMALISMSYLHQVLRALDPYWNARLKEARAVVHEIAKREYVTRLNVELSPEGLVHSVSVTETSGIPDFDRAALGAFADASPLGAAPMALIGTDGLVHIDDLGFIVSVGQAGFVRLYGDPRPRRASRVPTAP